MQKKYIPVTVFFVVLLVFLAHFGAKMSAVPAFTYAESRQVYLTFDDGPSTVVTNRVLDILKEENVKGTFFIVSDRAETRKDTLRRIAEEGHTLGVHSKTHEYQKIYASDSALRKDIDDCAKMILKTTGVKPRVYRFPGGGTKDKARQTALVESMGYRVVGWNAVCGDEEIKDADAATLTATAIETAQGKSTVVMLLHDSATHKATAEALPSIIAHFRAQGYTFCAF